MRLLRVCMPLVVLGLVLCGNSMLYSGTVSVKLPGPGNRKIAVPFEPDTTIGELKSTIERMADIPAEKQRLFLRRSLLARDTQTCAAAGIKEHTPPFTLTLGLKWQGSVVFVQQSERIPRIEVPFEGATTIGQLKEAIHEKTEIPAEQQHLLFSGNELVELERTCAEVGLKDASIITLRLAERGNVFVKLPNKRVLTIPFEGATISIADVKAQIKAMVGIPVEQQRLFLQRTGADLGAGGVARDAYELVLLPVVPEGEEDAPVRLMQVQRQMRSAELMLERLHEQEVALVKKVHELEEQIKEQDPSGDELQPAMKKLARVREQIEKVSLDLEHMREEELALGKH